MKKSNLTETSIKDIKAFLFDNFLQKLRISKNCGEIALLSSLTILEDMGLIAYEESKQIVDNLDKN